MGLQSDLALRLGLEVRERPPIRLADLRTAVVSQARVLNALILRETRTRYGKHKLGFLWALLEPTVSVAVFVAIFAALRQDNPSGMPLVPFMLVGFVSFSLFRDPMNHMQGAIVQSQSLLTFPQVTTFDVILARGLLSTAVTAFVLVLLLTLASLIGEDIQVQRPLGVVLVCLMMSTMGIGGGFLFASLLPIIPSMRQVSTQVLGRPLFMSSGLFFTIDAVPHGPRELLLWNPVLHMIELLRGEFFFQYETQYGSWLYASFWSIGTLAAGLLVHRALRRRSLMAAR